jgi:hypothetical protein
MPNLRIYKVDPGVNPNANPISITPGPTAGANPDDDTYDGNTGQMIDKGLWLASERTTLNANISAGDLTLVTDDDRFSPGVNIRIGTEKILIGSKIGVNLSALIRGYAGTTAAAHTAGDVIYAAYDFTNLTISAYSEGPPPGITVETGPPPPTFPIYLFQATHTPGAWLITQVLLSVPGSLAYNASYLFTRHCTILSGTLTQTKQNIKIRGQGTQNPSAP